MTRLIDEEQDENVSAEEQSAEQQEDEALKNRENLRKEFNWEGFASYLEDYLNSQTVSTRIDRILWTLIHITMAVATAGIWLSLYLVYHCYQCYKGFENSSYDKYKVYKPVEETEEEESEK